MLDVNYVLSAVILPALLVCFTCYLANIQTAIQFLLHLCYLDLHCFCLEKVKSLTLVQHLNLIGVRLGDVGGQETGPSPSLSVTEDVY